LTGFRCRWYYAAHKRGLPRGLPVRPESAGRRFGGTRGLAALGIRGVRMRVARGAWVLRMAGIRWNPLPRMGGWRFGVAANARNAFLPSMDSPNVNCYTMRVVLGLH